MEKNPQLWGGGYNTNDSTHKKKQFEKSLLQLGTMLERSTSSKGNTSTMGSRALPKIIHEENILRRTH